MAATGHRVEQRPGNRCHVSFELSPLTAPYLPVCRLAARRVAWSIMADFNIKNACKTGPTVKNVRSQLLQLWRLTLQGRQCQLFSYIYS